jgi:hypothetical protein
VKGRWDVAEPVAGTVGVPGAKANRVVLGKHPEQIQEALDYGGVFFDPGDVVLRRLDAMGISPWKLEEAFLRQQEEAGRHFELTLRGFTSDEVERLVEALPHLAKGDDAASLQILREEELPSYALEAKWLYQKGYHARVETGRVIWGKA